MLYFYNGLSKKKMIRNLGDASNRRTVFAQNCSSPHIHEHDSSVIRQKGASQNGCYKKTNISHPLIRTRAYKGLALKGLNDSNNVSVKTVLYGNPIFDESDNHKIL